MLSLFNMFRAFRYGSRAIALLSGLLLAAWFLAAGGTAKAAPFLTPDVLPDALKLVPYDVTIEVVHPSAVTPVVWFMEPASGSTLPDGVRLASSGTLRKVFLRGTPIAAGEYSFRVTAVDSLGIPYGVDYRLVVKTATLNIEPETLERGFVGASYSKLFSVVGGSPAYRWYISSGSLPSGVTLSGDTGRVSGIPTTIGTYTFQIVVIDGMGRFGAKDHNLTIVTPTALIIAATSLPTATQGSVYIADLQASGGVLPYSWALVPSGGALPTGITLDSTGRISGTPTRPGSYPFIVKVNDASGQLQTRAYTLTIDAPGTALRVDSGLPFLVGTVGTVYPSQMIRASGGTSPYTWSIASGAVPLGLSFSSGGVLSGTPTSAGTYTFTAQVRDAAGTVVSQSYPVTIQATILPLAITTDRLNIINISVGAGYPAQSLAATGGRAPYTWSLSSGSLPPGIVLSSVGVLSGTASVAGSYIFVVQVTDANGTTATRSYAITVSGPTSDPALEARLQNLTRIGVTIHALVKLPNDGNPLTQHDTAVYYVGVDGRRHAFPNEKTYFTWYSGFDTVRTIDATSMASMPLGTSATYRPGKRMVKFTSDNRVYVVEGRGILRWVASETAARQLYGASWTGMIDDISDAFYADYTFSSSPVNGTADYQPAIAQASVNFVSDSLRIVP